MSSTIKKPKKDKSGAVLVVGSGIAGIQASLDLANSGFKVYLLEEKPSIGGRMAQLDKTFPTNDCAMCIMAPKLIETGRHPNIELITYSMLEIIEGTEGNFKLKIKKLPRYVDLEKCTGCAQCEEVCPVEVKSEFDDGISMRHAIYRLYPQTVPNVYAIEKEGISPCRAACPAGVKCQAYVALISKEKFKEALDCVRTTLPFPSICGRTCHHPCEDHCNRAEIDEPVAIRPLKRFIADWARENGEDKPTPITSSKVQNVAIVGAGPGGLTCALRLLELGYKVTVFDRETKPGGMMTNCLPEYRIPEDAAMYDINRVIDYGVEVKLNTQIGKDISIKELKKKYDAIFIAIGAQDPAKLKIEGTDLKGVLYGLSFLRAIREGKQPEGFGSRIIIIGGGNVAIDCAKSALRLGAKKVDLICLETRNLESKDRMPAHQWEIEEAEEEGVKIQGYLGPKKILGTNGKVTGLETIRCTSVYEEGKFAPRFAPEEKAPILKGDTIIIAIGQRSNLTGFEEIETDRGIIKADPITLQTNISNIFAGGDIVRGPASIIEAVHDGNEAAISIDRYLCGVDLKEGREENPEIVTLPERFIEKAQRYDLPKRKPSQRIKSFVEIELPFDKNQAVEEAKRCINCATCSECLQCQEVCEADAINHLMQEETVEMNVGSIILASGFERFDPTLKGEYGYGRYKDVVTSVQFERILSASGPFQGHLQRLSDGKEPKSIAFIQCVGSRDTISEVDGSYCSAVCCMHAMKEAIIAKEHSPGVETTIFAMDIRAYGKGFDRYYERAEKSYGVKFIRARAGRVNKDNDHNLAVYYTSEDGKLKVQKFDMVVLSVGFRPSLGILPLSDKLGIQLNKYGYIKTNAFAPLDTTKQGIFACGVISSPKDIPETVMQASGAASCAAELLADARGTEIIEKTYPPERNIRGQTPRIGVFVCHCGINIGAIVDVPSVVEYAKTLPNVVYAEDNLFTCSQDTQQRIKQMIKEHNLNRVIVTSCSPRTHEPLFQETLRESGLNPRLFEMANIRDQCSWVHMNEPDKATEKAKDLVRMAVAKSRLLEPLPTIELDISQKGLVIGGGLTGMISALSIAEQGFEVALVEKEKELGGNLRNLYYTIEGQDIQEYLNSLIERIEKHPRIKVYKGVSIESIEGYIGNYKTQLAVSGDRLLPKTEIEHGIVVVATGAEESRPKEYLYGKDPRVITQLEFEKRLAETEKMQKIKGKKTRTEIQKLKSVVMIQCVGSRDDEHPYCSRVCCQEAVKNALKLKKINPKVNIYILYRDVRTYGFFEEYYQNARDNGIIFIRYEKEEKPIIEKSEIRNPKSEKQKLKEDKLKVRVRDPILSSQLVINPDLVVLAPAIVPRSDAPDISQMLKVPLNEDSFFLEAHVKLRPVDFAAEGIFLAGLAHSPKTIDESISQAKAAAARACTIISKDKYEAEAIIASVDEDTCAGCGVCENICTYEAVKVDSKKRKAVVNEVLCKGCGACQSACPSGAMRHKGFTKHQLLEMIEVATT